MSDNGTSAFLNQYLAGEAGGASSPAALLAEHPDPTVRMIAQLWSRNQAAAAEEDSSSAQKASETPADAAAIQSAAEYREARWRRRLARLRAELEHLRTLNDTLALALGACHLCWGQDENCEACYGRGQVGALAPQRSLFDQYVLPAVRRVRSGVSRPVAQSDPETTTSPPRREP